MKSSLQEAITTGVVPLNGHAYSHGEVLARPAIDELPALIWIGGVDQRVTQFNSRWLQFRGCTLQQALEAGWLGGVHPEDAAQRRAALDTAWETRAPFEMEYRLRCADGEYRWMLDHGAPRYGAGGEFLGYAGVAIDITERKRAEDELRWLIKAVEQSPASVMITDLHGKIEYVNPKFTSLTGYTLDEAVGQNPRILKSGETPAAEYRHLWETVQTGEWRGEFHNRKKNGELYWESASISPIRDAYGRPTHFIAVKEDITDRKRMETELRAAEERLRVAVESAQLYVYEVDTKTGAGGNYGPDDKFLRSLRSFEDWARAIHPDDRERVLAAHRQRLAGGPAVQVGYRLVDRDGNVRHFADHGASQRDGRLIGVLEDVTKARQAEEAQARLAAIVECSSNAIFSLDAQGVVRTWNAAAEQLYGYAAAEILGRPGLELSTQGGREAATRNIDAVTAGQTFQPFETEHMRKDGVAFPISIAASPIWDSQGKPAGCSVIVRGIAEEKRAEQALMESENRFRALIQNSNDVITLTDPAGVIQYDSPGVFDLLGVTAEQRIGRNALEAIHPDDLANLRVPRESLRGNGSRWRAQLRLRHADGSWRWCDCWATNLIDEPGLNAFVVSCRDITELKQAETALRESEERFRGLIEDATDIIFTTDLTGNFTSVNSMGERISGYSRQEITGTNILQYAVPECHETIVRYVMALASGENPTAVEVELIARDGHRVFLEVSGRLQLRDGVPAGLLGIARDIGQRKRVERLEQHRREVLEMVAQNQPLESVLCRVQEMIEHYYPGAVARIWATEGSGAQECGCLKYPEAAPGSGGRFAMPVLAGNGQVFGSLEISRFEPWHASESDKVLLDSMAKLASIAIEHRQLTQRLAYQAQHDSLTGLPNRSLLEDRLQQAIHLARRQSRLVAVLYVDLDRFKFINDTLGHHVGDLLLEESGKRLAGAVRGSDTLARTGGDEFVAVLSSIETEHDAEIVGERILEAMRTPFMVRGHELFVSASVGLSFFPKDGDDPANLQKHADVAMYEAKNRGRNRFQRFARSMTSASSERLEIENQLHRALDRGELELYYQPQFLLPSRRLGGMEALLRWNHPKWGLVPPNRFIPVAEDSGLIIPISSWVLREACRQHQAWRRAGYAPVKVAVNTSATQFARSSLAELTAEVLAVYEMDPCYLELELTEGVIMRDSADCARQIDGLRALGVRISIDDFGTGYSSLSYLQRLAIDDLKIDQSFVRCIDQAATAQPLVQAIVGLAHGLHLTATAEGVETESELAFLESIGCDQVQGFLLGSPAPADRWEAYWQSGGKV